MSDYNLFTDLGTLPVIAFMIAVCVLVHRFCLVTGKVLRIWKIDESVERMEKKENGESIGDIFKRILDPEKFRRDIGIKETPGEVRFDSR